MRNKIRRPRFKPPSPAEQYEQDVTDTVSLFEECMGQDVRRVYRETFKIEGRNGYFSLADLKQILDHYRCR